MLRALILNTLYAPDVRGGAERSLQLTAEGLVGLGVEVTVGCSAARARPPWSHRGVDVVYVGGLNLFWPFDDAERPALARKAWHLLDMYNPIGARKVADLVRACRPDIVHTNNLRGFSVSAWRAVADAGVPILHSIRDDYLRCARSLRWKATGPCAATCGECFAHAAVRRAATRRVAGVVAASAFLLDAHLGDGYFGAARLSRTVYNPAPELRPRAERAEGPTRFGFIGRIEPEKGVDLLLDAVARRPDRDWRVVIAGTGRASYLDGLRSRYADLFARGRAILCGWMEVEEFFDAVDVVVVPTVYPEPMSRVLLEAFSAGVPVIASRRGGMTEILEHDVNGILFEPADPASLDQALDRAAGGMAVLRPMVERGMRVAASLQADAVARRYRDAYEELLS